MAESWYCPACQAENPKWYAGAGGSVPCARCGASAMAEAIMAGHFDAPPGVNPYAAPRTAAEPLPGDTSQAGGSATAALVLGILSLLFWCLPIFGLPVSIAGLVLGRKGARTERRGMAVTGMVLCSIGLTLSLLNAAAGLFLVLAKRPAPAPVAPFQPPPPPPPH